MQVSAKRIIRASSCSVMAIGLVAAVIPFFRWLTADGSAMSYLAAAGLGMGVLSAIVVLLMYGFLSNLDQPQDVSKAHSSKDRSQNKKAADGDAVSGTIHTVTAMAIASNANDAGDGVDYDHGLDD